CHADPRADGRGGDSGRGRAKAHPRRPPGDWLGGGRPEGGRGPPGHKAFDLAGENEKTRNLPAPVVPARRQLYRPGGTSYLALPVLAANRLDPSDPQVLPSACLMKRSAKVRLAGT